MKTLVLSGVALLALTLPACSELGMCKQDSVTSLDSPTGRYSAEVVSADCVGTSKAKWVVMHQLEGTFKGTKTVAVFDDSDPDNAADIRVGWEDDEHLDIRAHGAKPWSFSPFWHGITVVDR